MRVDRRRFLSRATAAIAGVLSSGFDLERDDTERNDLARARPDDLARMRARDDEWFARLIG